MKNNPFTRFLSVALTAAMLVGVMPGAVLADAGEAIVGASSAVVESIPESTTPADAAPVATEVPPVTEPEATPETVVEPEASPEVEATPEATEEPEATPEATEQPEATPETIQEPEATPEATEQPETTPEATQEPEATPEATEEPEATPEATEEPETVDAQALLDELMALDDQAFLAAVDALTEEQAAALETLGEEALADYAARKQTLKEQNEKFASFYETLLKAETKDDYIALVEQLSQEEAEAFLLYLSQEQLDALAMKEEQLFADSAAEDATGENTFKKPVDYTNVAPFLPAVEGAALMPMRAFALPTNIPEVEDPTSENPNGLGLNKSIRDNQDGTYTITLESYVTGSISVEKEAAPTDIVLVLDQSSSMKNCINCGQSEGYPNHDYRDGSCTNSSVTYVPVYDIDINGTYYYYNGSRYKRVYYCDGGTGWLCSGGWFTQSHGFADHNGTKLTPKTSADSYGTQFYVQQESGKTYFKSRLKALKDAVTVFVNSVQQTAKDTSKNHRIAIVGFGSDAHKYLDWDEKYQNTELLSTEDEIGYQTAEWNKTYYQQALVSANVNGSVNSRLTNAIDRIAAEGGTATNLGMKMAQEVLARNPVLPGETRNQVVVVFTDGDPGIFTDDSNSTKTNNYANPAIATAKELKAAGVSVYTVGIFDGADASAPVNTEVTDWSDDAMPNRFMQYLSSNYKNAQSMSDGGAKTGDGYYLSASDSNALNDIFDKIADNIQSGSASVELDSSAVVKDVLTDEYKFATGNESQDIKVYTVKAASVAETGEITWDTQKQSLTDAVVDIDQVTKTATVTGFDFGKNFISPAGYEEGDPTQEGTYHGSKLVVEITVKPDYDETLGGNYIVSNTNESGIYENSSAEDATGKFNIPASDIDIRYDFTKQDKTIYISNSANLKDLFTGVPSVNGKNNAYVDIVYTVKDPDGKVVGTYTISHGTTEGSWTETNNGVVQPLDCTPYEITCSVTPAYDPSVMDGVETGAEVYSGTKYASIHVMVPKVSVTDSVIDLGDVADPNSNVTGYPGKDGDLSTTDDWVDKKGDKGIPEPIGVAPTVNVTPEYVKGATEWTAATSEYKPEEDVYFSLQVTVSGDRTMTLEDGQYTLVDGEWAHNTNVPGSYDTTGCIHDKDDSRDGIAFVIHVRQTEIELTIVKNLTGNKSPYGKAVFDFEIVDQNTGEVRYVHLDLTSSDTASESITVTANHVYKIKELSNMNYEQVGEIQWSPNEPELVGSDATTRALEMSGWKLTEDVTATFTNEAIPTKIPSDGSTAENKLKKGTDGNYILYFEQRKLGADEQPVEGE